MFLVYTIVIYIYSERYKQYIEDGQSVRATLEDNSNRVRDVQSHIQESIARSTTFVPYCIFTKGYLLMPDFTGNTTVYSVDLGTLWQTSQLSFMRQKCGTVLCTIEMQEGVRESKLSEH
jgi:hypothetical protein